MEAARFLITFLIALPIGIILYRYMVRLNGKPKQTQLPLPLSILFGVTWLAMMTFVMMPTIRIVIWRDPVGLPPFPLEQLLSLSAEYLYTSGVGAGLMVGMVIAAQSYLPNIFWCRAFFFLGFLVLGFGTTIAAGIHDGPWAVLTGVGSFVVMVLLVGIACLGYLARVGPNARGAAES